MRQSQIALCLVFTFFEDPRITKTTVRAAPYDHFYSILNSMDVDIQRVPRFAHSRYWAKKEYKVPWDSDRFQFPPLLDGNPHKLT